MSALRFACAALVLLVLAACTPGPADRAIEQQRPATAPVPVEVGADELARLQGIGVGRGDAPVVIYEFADFQCPACANFALQMMPLIKQQHVEAGTVRYVHYDFPLIQIHPHAFLAARAARCAHEQDRFWEYHDLLYAEQQTWSRAEDALPLFVELGRSARLEPQPFEACLRSDRYAEEISKHIRLGEALRVPGTPTLFINGRLARFRSLEELDRLIRDEAGTAGPG